MSDPVIPPLPELTVENIDLVFATMAMTEHNMALVFEQLHCGNLRYCDVWGKWLAWISTHWRVDSTLLAFHYAREISAKLNREMGKTPAKASFARGVEFLCRTSRHFATTPSQWDCESWLLNTPDDTINLESGQHREHSQSDHITKCTRVAPAQGPHPTFDRFLRDITLEDDSLRDYLQRSLGACLSGAIRDHWLIFWSGTGRNGKNTLGDLVMWMLGDYAKVIPPETLMSKKQGPGHPTDLANLRGLRLAIASEVSEGSYWDESRVKSLTGDSDISARLVHRDFFEFPRTHKHLVYGNSRPMLRVVDPAMRARLHIVPFHADFTETPDIQMPDKLKAEAPQIMQWLVDGHEAWIQDGTLKKCSAVQKETDSYFATQSTPELWIGEECKLDDGLTGQAGELYKSYKAWKEARGESPLSQTRWGEWMAVRYEKKNYSGRAVYKGLDLHSSIGFNSYKA